MKHQKYRYAKTGIFPAICGILLFSGCAERIDIKREWPMPLDIDTVIIKQCNSIHNTRCPENRGEMTNAIYYFDKRKLPEIESVIKKENPGIAENQQYSRLVLQKKIEYSSAYKGTFLRKSCSIEYYIMDKNVTCEKFIVYISRLKESCGDCIEEIKIESGSVSTY